MDTNLRNPTRRGARAWARHLAAAAAAAAGLLIASHAAAQAVYTYAGNPFNMLSCGPSSSGTGTLSCSTPAPTNPFTSYIASDSVRATLTLAEPLPPAMALQDVRTRAGFQLSLSDGHQTITQADQVGMFAEVGTDASGQINAWRLVINTGGLANGGVATVKSTSVFDQGVLACCDPTVSGDLGRNINVPGVWSSGTPSPAAAVASLIGLVSDPTLNLAMGQVNSLTDKLNNALASIQAGLNKQAINQLNTFVSAVQTLRRSGKISAQTEATLVDAANAIIAML